MESVLSFMCVAAAVALCGQVIGAASVPLHPHRHERSHKRFQHLQDDIDRLLLRQRTDHILITNLQKTMQEMQKGGVWPAGALTGPVREMEEEGRALARLRERVEDVRGSVDHLLQDEQKRDDILQVRQELAFLRSEVKHLKESRAAEIEQNAAHSHAQRQREAVTAAWVVDNVKRLQDAVVELQQALNVTTAMHDKQEVESRLLVVSRDLGALRSSLAAVTSKAEAAQATAAALQEELGRTSQDSHRSAGKVAALTIEVSGIREDFNNLLSVLPEGVTAAGRTASPPSSEPSRDGQSLGAEAGGTDGSTTEKDNHDTRLQKTIDAVQGRADNLDSTVRRLQRRADYLDITVSHLNQHTENLDSSVSRLNQHTENLDSTVSRLQKQVPRGMAAAGMEKMAKVTEAERQLEKRVETTETGVSEVRASSVQLLAALEALEARVEKDVTEVRQEVAKLEYEVAAAQDKKSAFKSSAAPSNSDLLALTRRMDKLALSLASVDTRSLQDGVALLHCHSRQSALDLRVNATMSRLDTLERSCRRCRHHQHHHHDLQPWQDKHMEGHE